MMDYLYQIGLDFMARPPLPGFISVGAILVRFLREIDLDDDRQDRMWLSAKALLDKQRE